MKDGSRVRAAGEGAAGANGGSAGDLYLRVHLKPHPVFERNGNDLKTKVGVPVTTAVLGGEAQVPTVTGSVRLKIPEGTQNGQVFRLKGHGMPQVGKPDDRGDLYASVEVQLPRALTREQRQHYEALQKLEKADEASWALTRRQSHEHQQVHGKSPGSGGRRAAARRPRRACGDPSRAPARHADRAARGHRALDHPEDRRGSRGRGDGRCGASSDGCRARMAARRSRCRPGCVR